MSDSIPQEPVKNVKIFDRPKDDKSLIVSWDKNKEEDVKKYRVYYTSNNFDEISLLTEAKTKGINVIDLRTDNAKETGGA